MLRGLVFWLLVSLAGAAHAAGTILVLGDSISAAYGLAQKDGWVALLGERLREKRLDYTVVNASISGETTAGGAARIDEALARWRPDVVVVALGGNDGLRGLAAAQMQANLASIVASAKAKRAKVLLLGMRMPPNYGPKYTREFEEAFAAVARAEKVPLVPFMLEGVGDRRDLFQPDNIHPTAAAQPIILDNVWKGLEPMLSRGQKTEDRRQR
ncbi:MAG: arylesterase [Burkholderiales bacterium]|nr:arylesterase [Burkholderiales bacterium]